MPKTILLILSIILNFSLFAQVNTDVDGKIVADSSLIGVSINNLHQVTGESFFDDEAHFNENAWFRNRIELNPVGENFGEFIENTNGLSLSFFTNYQERFRINNNGSFFVFSIDTVESGTQLPLIRMSNNRLAILKDTSNVSSSPFSQNGNFIFSDSTDNVGIGVEDPSQRLEVNGGMKLGNTSSPEAGAMRWNDSTQDFEGYINATVGWVSLTNPEPHVIGVTFQSTNGRVSFNGQNGWHGANEMCKVAFPAYGDRIRAFTVNEIDRANVLGNIPSSVHNVPCWAITSAVHAEPYSSQSQSWKNNSFCLGENASTVGLGQRITWLEDQDAVDYSFNGGGILVDIVEVHTNIGSGNSYRVMCGCYK